VEQLLAKGADPNVQAARGQTALMWAASQKHPAVVKALLAKGADVHVRSQSWTNMMAVPPHGYRDYNRQIPHGNDTALLFAARSGDVESAKLLIAAGAKVNDQDAWGITPLVFAAHSGFGELVKFLLSKDADPNLAAAGFAAIHIAIIRRDEAMSAALLAHGANPNLPLRTWTPIRRSSHDWYFHPSLVGATPVWLAARFTLPGVMRLLVERGADPRFIHQAHSVVERGFKKKAETTTTVMAALGMGSTGAAWVPTPGAGREALILETIKLAVEHGADVNAANTDGRTALAAAKTLGYETVVRYLVEKGAK
jgi:ankyrin repeat protein